MVPRALKLILLLIAIAIIGGIVWIVWPATPTPTPKADPSSSPLTDCHNFSEGSLTVGEYTLSVAIADEHGEQVQGLSGCAALPENSGMYFVYAEPRSAIFWMKDMLIPLDIIWVADGAVVGVNENVPAPAPGTSTSDLPQYTSPQEITGVLELSAGAANQLRIEKGDSVTNFVRN